LLRKYCWMLVMASLRSRSLSSMGMIAPERQKARSLCATGPSGF
jgi:hypothetical protein